jgi:WD40 repeat protein
MQLSADGSTLVAGCGRALRGWDVKTRSQIFSHSRCPENLSVLALSTDGVMAATGTNHGMSLWNLRTGKPKVMTEHATSVRALAFSANGELLANGSLEETWDMGTITLRNARSGEIVSHWSAHRGHVEALRFSKDGRQLYSGGCCMDKLVKAWTPSGTEIGNHRLKRSVEGIWLGPDDRSMLLGQDSWTGPIRSFKLSVSRPPSAPEIEF